MNEHITNGVQTERRNKNMTQVELAEQVSVSRQTIVAIEKGNYAPSVLLAIKIAHVFKKNVEDIFSITYEK